MRYLVVIEKGSSNYGAYVPDLPGCMALGETRDEATRLILEAMEFHIKTQLKDGQAALFPASQAELVEAAA